MYAESLPGPEVAFGPFTLDLTEGELRRNGLRLHLQPQARQLLVLLASYAGQAVTRRQIRDHIWGVDTCIDFEHALNFCVCQLRATLRDPAGRPRYIETLPRRGYRFIATTHSLQSAPAARSHSPGGSGGPPMERTVVILPYRTSDGTQQPIAEGMTDCLIATLSKIAGLRIIPAESVMDLKKSKPLTHQLAFRLDANWIVEGRIFAAGKRIRITSQLVDAPLGNVLWSEQQEDHIRNILCLQTISSRKLAQAVSFHMARGAGDFGQMTVHSR